MQLLSPFKDIFKWGPTFPLHVSCLYVEWRVLLLLGGRVREHPGGGGFNRGFTKKSKPTKSVGTLPEFSMVFIYWSPCSGLVCIN